MKNGIWKQIAIVLMSVLATGLISWFSFGGGVRASEVKLIVNENSPYLKDKNLIFDRIERNEQTVSSLNSKIEAIQTDISDIKGDIKVILERTEK